ncbi:MAG TPA: MFS transporter [Armatimonadota bacterium]
MSLPAEQSQPSPLSVLGQRNFRLYWGGQLVSLTGGWMQQTAMAWVTMTIVHSAMALGVMNVVAAIPPAVLMLHGGVAADKLDKRRILMVTQTLFMVVSFVLAYLVWAHRLSYWHIIIASLISGVGMAFDLPANQALVPELVDREQIPAAVQLNQAIFHGSRMIGPGFAGAMIRFLGEYSAFVANGISFLPVIGTLAVIRSIRPSESHVSGSATEAMREGFAYVRVRPQLLALLGMTALTTTLVFPNFAILMPFYVKNVLKMDAAAVGLVMSVGGGAAFLSAMSLLVVPEQKRVTRIGHGFVGICTAMIILWAGPALGQTGVRPGSLNLAMTCLGVAVMSASVTSALGLGATILQQTVPDELRGRVMSLQSLTFIGIMPFGALMTTALVDAMTMPNELLLAAGVYGLGAAYLLGRLKNAHAEGATEG